MFNHIKLDFKVLPRFLCYRVQRQPAGEAKKPRYRDKARDNERRVTRNKTGFCVLNKYWQKERERCDKKHRGDYAEKPKRLIILEKPYNCRYNLVAVGKGAEL